MGGHRCLPPPKGGIIQVKVPVVQDDGEVSPRTRMAICHYLTPPQGSA